ncbi:methyltransferase domain-containing protein [Alkalihalophilus marmarensis]|uniref:Methyltransferase domain-containing protein n=1 Tax=Alkalihalophilus marmarensis DSM 21297 TaxID=1188261 RepID=U6SQ03_9BACI|nr:methyltransferase domain-containing protein [Alkalihalophilus marmarensis]ERN52970.1 hypothetical protein A33I_13470 [Alkalihalophilus marmarensis DSM 21297]MCM3488966.1 methyltransferase domain-containing protein [Alkalihalophilus marmarensis]
MAFYTCAYCSFRYNEQHGDSKNGVPKGTPFAQLAGTLCSRCGMQGDRHIRQANPKYKGLEAQYYDLFAGKSGVAFFREWVLASKNLSHVLDLGTGTGRIAVELANVGIPVTGVDWSKEMLALANKKANRITNQMTLIEEDALILNCKQTFSHVLLADGFFQYFTTVKEQQELLAMVRNHLGNEGRIAIDLIIPPPTTLWKNQHQKQMTSIKTVELTVEGFTSLREQLFHYSAMYEVYREGVSQTKYKVERELSFITPRELAYLLKLEGFSVTDMVCDYQPNQKIGDTIKVAESSCDVTPLSVDETLEDRFEDINKGRLHPYTEDSWKDGGYPFGVKSTANNQPIMWTIIAELKEKNR